MRVGLLISSADRQTDVLTETRALDCLEELRRDDHVRVHVRHVHRRCDAYTDRRLPPVATVLCGAVRSPERVVNAPMPPTLAISPPATIPLAATGGASIGWCTCAEYLTSESYVSTVALAHPLLIDAGVDRRRQCRCGQLAYVTQPAADCCRRGHRRAHLPHRVLQCCAVAPAQPLEC